MMATMYSCTCTLLVFVAFLRGANGHGAMTFPKPRNSIDSTIAPWTNWAYPCDAKHQGLNCRISFCENGENCSGSCPVTTRKGIPQQLDASNGQACYWFSNGCTIGCDKCDGTQNHVGHGNQKFLYQGMNSSTIYEKNITIENPFSPPPGNMVLDPATTSTLNISANCNNPKNATICEPSLRTCNTQAECGSDEDFYYFSPWRAPGSAPVIDSCGSAGGRYPGQGIGGAGAQFENSTLAKQGDLGSKLPPMAPQATWKRGVSYEVGWTVMANHGGGYSYRLAPIDEPLTEETFQKLPLDFVGDSILRWDGNNNSQLVFSPAMRGWQTNVGTTPLGSMWRKNPIPSGLWEREGAQFDPVCTESEECIRMYSHNGPPVTNNPGVCRCSGYSNGGPLLPNLEIVDNVQIPEDLAPGRYVLQWRWDCEESDQVWTSCSDVSIVA